MQQQDSDTMLATFNAWIEEGRGWRLPPCPVSNSKNWILADDVLELRPTGMRQTFGRGQFSYPIIMLTCGDCGYAMFFSAALLGLE